MTNNNTNDSGGQQADPGNSSLETECGARYNATAYEYSGFSCNCCQPCFDVYWNPMNLGTCIYPSAEYFPYCYHLPCYNPPFCLFCQRPYACQLQCVVPGCVQPLLTPQLTGECSNPYCNSLAVLNPNDKPPRVETTDTDFRCNCGCQQQSEQCEQNQQGEDGKQGKQGSQKDKNSENEKQKDKKQTKKKKNTDLSVKKSRSRSAGGLKNFKATRLPYRNRNALSEERSKNNYCFNNDESTENCTTPFECSKGQNQRGDEHWSAGQRLPPSETKLGQSNVLAAQVNRVLRPTGLGSCGTGQCSRTWDISPRGRKAGCQCGCKLNPCKKKF